MTRRIRSLALTGAVLLTLAACKDEEAPPPPKPDAEAPAKPAGDTVPAKATAETSTEPPAPTAKPPERSALRTMLEGDEPAEVKLIKGHGSTWSHKYPAGWAAAPGRDFIFMVMKRSADAAMFCEPGNAPFLEELHVSPGLTKNLAKRAPILGKDLEAVGDDEMISLGGQKIRARAGHMKGNLFGAPDGDLFWWDFRMKQKEGLPVHVNCLAAIKAGADEHVERELQAVVRSIRIPPDDVMDPIVRPEKKK